MLRFAHRFGTMAYELLIMSHCTIMPRLLTNCFNLVTATKMQHSCKADHSDSKLSAICTSKPWVHWTISYYTGLATLESMAPRWKPAVKNWHRSAVVSTIGAHVHSFRGIPARTNSGDLPKCHRCIRRPVTYKGHAGRTEGLPDALSPPRIHLSCHIAMYFT